MKNLFKFSILAIALLISCQDDLYESKAPKKLPTVAITTLKKEPQLKAAIESLELSDSNTAGRVLMGLSEFSQDSIIKFIQSDELNYTYTLKLKSSEPYSFRNLIFRKTKNGFLAFVLEYKSNNFLVDLATFNGEVKRYDLEGNLLGEALINPKHSGNGRTASCNVGFSKTCSEEQFDGWDQATGTPIFRCLGYTTYITFDCTENFTDRSIASQGTYVYDSNQSSGSGGGSSGSVMDPDTEFSTFDEGDPVGVIEVTPSKEEIEAWIESITDPEERRKAQLDYLRTHGASDFVRMVEDFIDTPGITVGEVWDTNAMVNTVYLNQKAEFFIAIFNPETVGTILSLGFYSPALSAPMRSNYFRLVARYAATNAGRGYSSFEAFKQAEGVAGEGKAWHHLVQQTETNVQRFGPQKVHNVNNIVSIEHGAGSWHQRITNYYNKIQDFTGNKRFYEWVADKSFEEQYEWAVKIMELTKLP